MMFAGIGDQNPSPEKIGWLIILYVSGVSLMYASDAQKNFVRKVRPGLIDHGLFGITRNPNYLGEVMLYGSFGLLVDQPFGYAILLTTWSILFMIFMAKKEASLRRKDGWAAYSKRSWMFLPKLVPSSSMITTGIYVVAIAIGYKIWLMGGMTALLSN
jgi:protein-S-isoprenylcysteine O-methyltransferase Ste14